MKTKLELAKEFVKGFDTITFEEFQELLDSEVGDDLSSFFDKYAADMIQITGTELLHLAAPTLMLLGYLVRAHEEKSSTVMLPKGSA